MTILEGVESLDPAPSERVRHPAFRDRIMSAEQAVAIIRPGATVGMSGFTGAGYPKAVPQALANRILEAKTRGENFRITVWTGASTAPELDGALAEVDGIEMRLPYQSDPACRKRINAGEMDYLDLHLSHVAQFMRFGFLGRLDVAVVEVTGIDEQGRLIPSSSVGNNLAWLEGADQIILEVNSWQPTALQGMHDIYYGAAVPPHRKPIPILAAGDRIGEPYLRVDPEKVVAVVPTDAPDRNSAFKAPDDASMRIAGHILDFLDHEVALGRLPANLLPLQSGVGNVANAVLSGLDAGPYRGLTAYTEVLQDGMLDMLLSGTMSLASATAFSLSPAGIDRLLEQIDELRTRIVLRPQEISNHPEVIRRLGVIAMNGAIEADVYGNINSTHVMGSSIMNGIGGSGDFAHNAFVSIFMTPSTAKAGAISAIVPMVSHVDHTEHDVGVIVTEQGLADLRGLAPRQRARAVVAHCAHPDYRDALTDYLDRAERDGPGRHTPHLLQEALGWHVRYLETGHM